MDNSIELLDRIDRYKRLAEMTTDDQARQALEELVEEYEARLPRRGPAHSAGFMLQRK